jgi:hypothetical protein
MAGTAVEVDFAGLGLAVGAVRFTLMLMGVVAEMLRRSSILMLAIYSRCRPRELEWHDRQQEDKKQLFHDEIVTRW